MTNSQVLQALLHELILSWSQYLTPREVALDEQKLQLLMATRDLILDQNLQVSNEVREFYTGVFLRDELAPK